MQLRVLRKAFGKIFGAALKSGIKQRTDYVDS
jgi:hypothetical protein